MAVHSIILLFANRQSTESNFQSVISCRSRSCDYTCRAIFLLCTCSKTTGFEMIPVVKRTSEPGAISNIFKQAIHRFLVGELGRRNVVFDWRICLSLFELWLKKTQRVHLCKGLTQQHLGFWNLLEKLALFFLYNFYREHSMLKLVFKKLSPKIIVKNIKTRVVLVVCFCCCF